MAVDEQNRQRRDQFRQEQDGPLLQAMQRKQFLSAERLIKSGERLNRMDRKGKTPLDYAVASKFPTLVELLLRKGAKASGLSQQTRGPLHWAAIAGNRTSIRQLLDSGAEKGARDELGMTPAALALCAGETECVASLLGDLDSPVAVLLYSLLVDDTTEFLEGLTAVEPDKVEWGVPLLFLAALTKNTKAVDALIKAGCDVDLPLANGTTALMLSVSFSSQTIGRRLLKANADPNLVNKKGHYALDMAFRNGSAPWAKLLLENGARPAERGGFKTLEDLALSLASDKPNSRGRKLLDLLYQYGSPSAG